MSSFNVETIRKQFPMLTKMMHGKPLVYLDSAATTQKPQCVIDAICDFYSSRYATVHRAVYELAADATFAYDMVRQSVQRFMGAQHLEEIIFTRGTTESINLVASCFSKSCLSEGDEVLICETEHHSNIVPWQMACKERGAKINVIPCDDNGEIDLVAFERLLHPKVKLVAVAHVSNLTGTIHPIEKIISMSHAIGAKVLVDGAQSISHMEIDVKALDIDFYAFSGHKAYGPTGIGILYGKKGLLEALPPYHGGGDMVDEVRFEHTTYQKLPLKFEAGTPLIAEVIGLGAALDFISSIGRKKIATWEHQLLDYAVKKMSSIPGLRIIGNARNKGPIITFVVDGIHPLDLGTMLSLKGVAIRTGHMCAQPTLRKYGLTSAARISFGIYNTFHDVDRLIDAMQEVMMLLRPEVSY
jgi:cysteine desulfurase/selenocysteine lyase